MSGAELIWRGRLFCAKLTIDSARSRIPRLVTERKHTGSEKRNLFINDLLEDWLRFTVSPVQLEDEQAALSGRILGGRIVEKSHTAVSVTKSEQPSFINALPKVK